MNRGHGHTKFIIRGKYIKYDEIHDFSVWLKTGSNPADIHRLRRHIGTSILFVKAQQGGGKHFLA